MADVDEAEEVYAANYGTVWLPGASSSDKATRIPFSGKLPISGPVFSSRQLTIIVVSFMVSLLFFVFLRLVLPIWILGDWFWTFVLAFVVTIPVRMALRTSGAEALFDALTGFRFRLKLRLRAALPEKIGPWRPQRVQLIHMYSCIPSPSGRKSGEVTLVRGFRTHGLRPMAKFPDNPDILNNNNIVDPELVARESRFFEPIRYRADIGEPVARPRDYDEQELTRMRRAELDAEKSAFGNPDAAIRYLDGDDDE